MEHEILATIRLRIGGVGFECWDIESMGDNLRATWQASRRELWQPRAGVAAAPIHIYDEVMRQWWAVTDERGQQIVVTDEEFDAAYMWRLVQRTRTGMEQLHQFSRRIEEVVASET